MIFSLVFLALSTWVGLLISAFSTALRGWMERLAVGFALALALQMWVPFAIARFWGIAGAPGASLAIFVVTGLLLTEQLKERNLALSLGSIWSGFVLRLKNRNTLWLLAFFVALIGFVSWLFFTHCLLPGQDGLMSAGICWEDMCTHAMYASSFVYSDNLQALEYPNFTGWPLGYPFLSNVVAAVMMRFGSSVGEALWLSSCFAFITLLITAWTLMRSWLNSRLGASITIVLFLLSAGFGFIEFFGLLANTGKSETPMTFFQVLMSHDYANEWDFDTKNPNDAVSALHYHNPLVAVLLPMRTSLFGMPIAFVAIMLLARVLRQGIGKGRRELVLAGILLGSLPMINAHSFVVCAWTAGIYAACFVRWKEMPSWRALAVWFALPMLIIAIPQVLWIRGQISISEPGFVRFHFGAMNPATNVHDWIWYLFHNTGIRLVLAAVGWFLAPPLLKKLSAPFLGLFILGNVMVFQPFAYDNIKLFAYGDLACAAVTVPLLFRLWKITPILPVVLGLLLTLSGILSVVRESYLRYLVIDWDGVAFADMVRNMTSPRAILLTGSGNGQPTHPVQALTGRPLVLGFKNWLNQHGINYAEREADVREMYAGGPRAIQLLKKYNVQYVVVGPSEQLEFPNLNVPFLERISVFVAKSGSYTLYQIQRH